MSNVGRYFVIALVLMASFFAFGAAVATIVTGYYMNENVTKHTGPQIGAANPVTPHNVSTTEYAKGGILAAASLLTLVMVGVVASSASPKEE